MDTTGNRRKKDGKGKKKNTQDTEAAKDLGRDVLKPLQTKGLCINPAPDFDISHGCAVGCGGVEGVCTGLIQRSSKFMPQRTLSR